MAHDKRQRRQAAATGGHAAGGHTAGEHATEGCCDANPNHKPSRARGPPIDWGELVQVHDDRAIFQASDRRAARDRHPQPLTGVGREASKPRDRPTKTRSAPTREKRQQSGCGAFRETCSQRPGRSSRDSRVAHQPEDRCGGAIDRAILHIPMYSGDPIRRARQLIYTSEDLRAITDEWERIWFLDQPSPPDPVAHPRRHSIKRSSVRRAEACPTGRVGFSLPCLAIPSLPQCGSQIVGLPFLRVPAPGKRNSAVRPPPTRSHHE